MENYKTERNPVLRRMHITPLGYCFRVIVNEKPLNLEKTTTSVLSVLLLIYVIDNHYFCLLICKQTVYPVFSFLTLSLSCPFPVLSLSCHVPVMLLSCPSPFPVLSRPFPVMSQSFPCPVPVLSLSCPCPVPYLNKFSWEPSNETV